MALDLTSFDNALARLHEGMDIYAKDTSNTMIRDGLIQRFEFTYELAHKMLKRALEAASPTPGAYDAMSFAELIRSGNEQGLLRGDWPQWRKYRDMRARSSHTYDEKMALDVVAGIAQFLADAVYLRDEMRRRHA